MPSGNNELLISKEQFNQFVKNHSNVDLPIYPESNEAMTESYLMIDPQGRFYQNSSGSCGYNYSESIIDCGVGAALNQIRFNPVMFNSRYKQSNIPAVEL